MFSRSLRVVLLGVLGFYGAMSSAEPVVPTVNCVDHEHRFTLKDFTPSGHGTLGSLTLIDSVESKTLSLFCGWDASTTQRIEVACVSSHGGGGETVIRVRTHVQRDPSLPKVALLEVQKAGEPFPTINEIIPLVCE